MFVGDVGRPDLLDEALGGRDTRYGGAEQLYESLRQKFLPLPDWVQVLPGHGAGSACGKSLSAVPTSTVGYERRFSWWGAPVQAGDRERFVAELLDGQPDVPSYFARMKRLNRDGPPPLGEPPQLRRWTPDELAASLAEVILVDTRSADLFRVDAVAGALHVPAGRSFTTYASYALDPELDQRPIVLLSADEHEAEELRGRLALIGIDDVIGFTASLDGLPRRPIRRVPARDVAELREPLLLDVRSSGEFDGGHLPGARQIHVGRLRRQIAEVPPERPVVVYCQGGARAAVAEAVLLSAGHPEVYDLAGSYDGWRAAAGADATVAAKADGMVAGTADGMVDG